ncbi:MAG: methyl-accepting chemotaxis protein [Spirochaetales bacterium]|nr:methyl-accepting chemotaxis protein [Spirochaetales bacterium]
MKKTGRSAKIGKIKLYSRFSVGFGLLMGLIFPWIALFFLPFPHPLNLAEFLIACLLAGWAVGWVSFLIGKKMLLEPVVQVIGYVEKNIIESQDYRNTVTVDSPDRLGDLAGTMNRLVERTRLILGDLKEMAEQNTELAEEFRSRFGSTVETSRKFSDSAVLLSDASRSLETQLLQASGFLKELQSFSEKVYTDLEKEIEGTQKANEGMEKIFQSLSAFFQESNEKLHQLESYFTDLESFQSQIKKSVREIARASESNLAIAKNVLTIKRISARTNILAINSSIEAAHAGEFGRGFSVVADEIRQLAEATDAAASAITRMLGDVAQDVDVAQKTVTQADQVAGGMLTGLEGFRSYFHDVTSRSKILTTEQESQKVLWETMSSSLLEVQKGSKDFLQKFSLLDGILGQIQELSSRSCESFDEWKAVFEQLSAQFDEAKALTEQQWRGFDAVRGLLERFKTQ